MQDRQVEEMLVPVPIPSQVLAEAEIGEGDMLQITAEKGKITIEKATDISDFVCDEDCENCPVNETDCDGDCESCPCCKKCD